jgi:arylsulfatase A-like enzyme
VPSKLSRPVFAAANGDGVRHCYGISDGGTAAYGPWPTRAVGRPAGWPARIPAGRVSEQVTANMDWLPTLLAAARTATDPTYLADGMNLLPHLFWRYKALWQRAARIGEWKYLKILDNTFLFNVADDPLERTNLNERHQEI